MNSIAKILRLQSKRPVVVAVFILVVMGGVFAALQTSRRQALPDKLKWKAPVTNKGDNSRDKRSLREKARESGKYVALESPPDLSKFNNLEDLARRADAVVVAKAVKNVCKLSPDEKTVTIDYEMKVEHSYRGDFDQKGIISVSLPGGLAKFPEGGSADIRTPWFRKMMNGHTYLLFLDRQGNGPFKPTGGPRGLFGIPTDNSARKVTAHSMLENDPMQVYQEMEVVSFLRAVKRAVQETK